MQAPKHLVNREKAAEMTLLETDKLETLAAPVVSYLQRNHHPHTAVVITATRAVIVED